MASRGGGVRLFNHRKGSVQCKGCTRGVDGLILVCDEKPALLPADCL
jgi:hypothetical protein